MRSKYPTAQRGHKATFGPRSDTLPKQKAILLSSITGSRLPQKNPHADVLRLIRATVIKLPIPTKFQHIYGHQDKWLPYSSLSRPSQLNVICDKLAKAGLKRDISHNTQVYDILPQEQISIFIDGSKVTGSVGRPLRDAISKIQLRNHLDEKGILSAESFDHIDWQGIYGAMNSFST